MIKYLKILFALVATTALTACSSDEDPAFGSISGRVYDYATHSPLSGVSVSLTPGTRSLITDESGNFVFSELESGSYTVSASLKGYTMASSHVNVNIGSVTRTDIQLKSESLMDNLQISTAALTFDKGIKELTFEIKNVGENGTIKWTANLITVDWLDVVPREGSVAEGMANIVKVIVNRDAIPSDKSVSTSFNISTGETSKSISVYVNNTSGGNENPVVGSISGQITNASNRTPVSGARIFDSTAGVSVISDVSGNYVLQNLQPGNHRLEVSAEGFETKTSEVYVSGGSSGRASFELTPVAPVVSVSASTKEVEFGLTDTRRTVTLYNNGNTTVNWSVFETSEYSVPSWLSISAKSGTIAAGSSKEITMTVDRSKMDNTFEVFIVGIQGDFEDIDITVSVEKEAEQVKEDYSKASIQTCDYRVKAEIIGCHRYGSDVVFEFALTNDGLGFVNDWRIYPPKSMSLIQGGTRSDIWTDDGNSYDYPTITFNNKSTSSANVLNTSFPERKVTGSVKITGVSSSAKEFNLTLGVYAYPNSQFNMSSSAVRFKNVPIY